jgi:hypothetical protein
MGIARWIRWDRLSEDRFRHFGDEETFFVHVAAIREWQSVVWCCRAVGTQDAGWVLPEVPTGQQLAPGIREVAVLRFETVLRRRWVWHRHGDHQAIDRKAGAVA